MTENKRKLLALEAERKKLRNEKRNKKRNRKRDYDRAFMEICKRFGADIKTDVSDIDALMMHNLYRNDITIILQSKRFPPWGMYYVEQNLRPDNWSEVVNLVRKTILKAHP